MRMNRNICEHQPAATCIWTIGHIKNGICGCAWLRATSRLGLREVSRTQSRIQHHSATPPPRSTSPTSLHRPRHHATIPPSHHLTIPPSRLSTPPLSRNDSTTRLVMVTRRRIWPPMASARTVSTPTPTVATCTMPKKRPVDPTDRAYPTDSPDSPDPTGTLPSRSCISPS